MSERISWPQYALDLAYAAATRSEDPYRKVGAALLRPDRTVAALGYNGAPPGVEVDWSDRDGRRIWMLHAEANALRYVHPGEVSLMAATMMPCTQCILLAAAYKIHRVVYAEDLTEAYDPRDTAKIAAACGITIEKWRPQG